MLYRPTGRLDELRLLPDTADGGDCLLPWLRTLVLKRRWASPSAEGKFIQLMKQRFATLNLAPATVDRIILHDLTEKSADLFLENLCSVSSLKTFTLSFLDLQSCHPSRIVTDLFLDQVATAASTSLRRLLLPWHCPVHLSTLERFTMLEELGVNGSPSFVSVYFCASHLKALYANCCENLTDVGLRDANRLEVLQVREVAGVTDLSPFAHCLLELDASEDSGIHSEALVECHRLQVLNASGNRNIMSLAPLEGRLRELAVDGSSSGVRDGDLAGVRGLVSFSANCNDHLTTIAPFASSLRVLQMSGSANLQKGFQDATNIVSCSQSYGSEEVQAYLFGPSLLELDASFNDLDDASSLTAATNLVWLDVTGNSGLTTLTFCAATLRHLSFNTGLTDESLRSVTQLVSLNSSDSGITTIAPFHGTLEKFTHWGESCGVVDRELLSAPALRVVWKDCPLRVKEEEEEELVAAASQRLVEFEAGEWMKVLL